MAARRLVWIVLLLLLQAIYPAMGQNHDAFTIENNQMVLYLDLGKQKHELDSLLKIADIKGVSINNLLHGDYKELEKDGWMVRKVKYNTLLLLKPWDELAKNPQVQPIMITQSLFKTEKRPGYPGDVVYGINKFSRRNVNDLPGNFTRFFIPGFLKAKRVLLSGNFNNWSTLKGIMTKTDSGWIADVKLQPGEYLYKFIVDGHWLRDAGNLLKDEDGFNDYNSVYYKYNHTFKLAGYSTALRVMLVGSFNNNNANEIVMAKSGNTWVQSLYLKEGTYNYHFLVDGHWITDPADLKTHDDGHGHKVSIINIGTLVTFKLNGNLRAGNVILAGDFNNWSPGALHMQKTPTGWTLPLIMPAGNYGYKFIVDGNWIVDPLNQRQFTYNGNVNSLVVVKPNHTFTLNGYANAHTIRISGTFNNWDENGYTLAHTGNQWTISLHLNPGKQLYKFLVDGNWIIDPGNKLWEQNEFGTGNSVLWME
jgi:hypothetical protein